MKIPHEEEVKHQLLNEQNVLYKKADTVSDELFQTLDFFDPHDMIQVKYEMVRRVQKEGWSVTHAAAAFGFSRISYYTIQHTLETHGLMGLMPKKRGPKQPTKLTDAVLKFIEQHLEQDPTVSSQKLQALAATQLGVEVHKRTIERALQRKKKPPGTTSERSGAGA
jgi:transposase